MVFDLLTVPNETKLLSTLRYVWCAGAPLSGEAQRRMIDMLDPTAIFSQVWGMSEVGWITTFHFPESDTSGSVGRLLPNMEAKLVNECGDDILEDDRTGEVLVRGPSVMTGYLGDRKATEASFVDGWLKTGDIGHCKSGKWYIIDRAKELIKVRGWQISPTELEACLLMHPAIIDAAVIGVEYCEQSGELPRAYVVLNKSFRHSVSELDIQGYFHGYLAKYKALTGGVRIVGSIPKSSSGKVLRKVLKEVAACEIAREIDSNRAES
ncbi:hypothetical protein MMC17_005987 [Xylographa soralifera]|nr:hypothetical protein [Xylographa soralifera]